VGVNVPLPVKVWMQYPPAWVIVPPVAEQVPLPETDLMVCGAGLHEAPASVVYRAEYPLIPDSVSWTAICAAAEVTVTSVMVLVQFAPSADTCADEVEKPGGVVSGGSARIVNVLVTMSPAPFQAVKATWLVPSATNCASGRP